MAEKKFELKFAAQTSGSDQLNKLTRAVEDLGSQGNQTAKLLDKIGQSAVDSDRQLASLAKTVANLSRELSSGESAAKKMQQATTDSARQRIALEKELLDLTGSFAQQSALRRKSISAENLALFDQVEAIKAQKKAAADAALDFAKLGASVFAVKAIGDQFIQTTRNILETQAQVDKLRNILLVKNDNSIANTNKDLDTLRATSERLGLRFTETATAFAKLAVAAKGSALEGKATRDIFEAVSGTIAKLGVSGDGANRVFLALQQIISKGTVQTEELKGQLGEQIPGAMQIAARAVGVTTSEFAKMLEQGQVISADFLPKFAAEMSKTFGVSTTDSVNTATAAINRFDNATERLKQTLAEKLAPAATTVFGGLGSALDSLSEKISSSQGLFDLLFKTIADAPQIALDFATGIGGGQTIAKTQEGRAAQLGQLEAALAKAQSESGKGGIYTRSNTANAIADLKRLIAEIKVTQGAQEDVGDEFLTTLIAQGRQQAENFKNLERGYKEQGDAIKGINKDYEIQIKLAKDARAAGVISDAQLQTRLGEINAKFGEKDKRAEVAKAAADEYAKLYQRVVDLTTAENLREASGVKLNNFMKLGNDLINEANEGTSKLTAQQRQQIIATGESLIAIGKVNAERELERDLIEQAAKEMSKQGEAFSKTIEGIERENQSLREKIASVGVSNEQAAEAINLTDEARVQALELSQALYTEADAWDFVRISQEKELEALRERIKLRKELGAARDAQAIADRQAASFTNLYRDLARGISDSIFRGFESSKKFIDVFKDAIRNAFKTFAIKVAIQPVIGSIIGTIAGSLGFQGLANAAVKELGGGVLGELGKTGATPFGGSGGGSLSAIGGAKSIYDMVGGGFSALSGSITNGLIRVGDFLATSQSDFLANIGTSINSGSFASNAGAFGAKAAGVAGGYAANRFLSNGYQVGGVAGKIANNASLIGFVNPVAGLIAGAIGGAVNRLFGSKRVLGASGIEGEFSDNGFSGRAFQDVTIKRKLRSDKSFTDYFELEADTLSALGEQFSSLTTAAKAASRVLGRDMSSAIDRVRVAGRFQISTADEMKATLDRLSNEIIEQTIPALESFQEEGENLVQTAGRVAGAVASANEAAILLGQGALFSLGNAKDAISFQQQLGDQSGLLTSALQAFIPESELARRKIDLFKKNVRDLGIESRLTAETTRAQFAAMLEQIDLNTEAGQRELSLLISVAPALDALITARESEKVAVEAAKGQIDAIIASVDGSTNAFAQADAAIVSLTAQLFNTTDIQSRLDLELALAQQIQGRYALERQLLDTLQSEIGQLQGSIGSVRVAVSSDIASIIGTPLLMSKDQISAAVTSASEIGNLPTLSAVTDAQRRVDDKNELIAQKGRDLQNILSAESQIGGARALLGQRAQEGRNAVAEFNRNTIFGSAYATASDGGIARASFDEASLRAALDYAYITYTEGRESEVDGLRNQINPSKFAIENTVNPAIAAQQSEVDRLQNIINGKGSAQSAIDAAKSELSSAQQAVVDAKKAFSDGIQKFAIDAGKAVEKLSALREETVKYFQAQQALANLYNTSAAQLRGTVAGVRFNRLSEQEQFNQLRAQFDTAVLLSKSLEGDALVAQADKVNSLIEPLLSRAAQLAPNAGAISALETSLLSQAEEVASRLEGLAPKDFQQESIDLLSAIDASLVTISDSTLTAEKLIVEAINISRDSTLLGLRGVVAAVQGKEVPAFAAGGSFGGGLRLVGERGPELEVTGPSRIFSAAQTQSIMSGAMSNSVGMAQELRAIRKELQDLRQENFAGQTAIASGVNKTARILDRADNGDSLNITMVPA